MLPSCSLFWDGGAKVPAKNWTQVRVGYPHARLALDGDVLSLTIHPRWLGPVSKRRAHDAAIKLSPADGAIVFLVKGSGPLKRGLGIGRPGHRPAYFWRRRSRHDILRSVEAAGFTVSRTERRSGYFRDSERMTRPLAGTTDEYE